MTRRLLNWNPASGERVWFDYTPHTEEMTITHEQDVDHILEYTHRKSTNPEHTKQGMKEDWWQYAKVPNSVIMEMKDKHGVDFFSEEDAPKVFKLLNTEYKAFKTTDKTHNVRKR
jgi:hypothetical protein